MFHKGRVLVSLELKQNKGLVLSLVHGAVTCVTRRTYQSFSLARDGYPSISPSPFSRNASRTDVELSYTTRLRHETLTHHIVWADKGALGRAGRMSSMQVGALGKQKTPKHSHADLLFSVDDGPYHGHTIHG